MGMWWMEGLGGFEVGGEGIRGVGRVEILDGEVGVEQVVSETLLSWSR